MKFYDKSIYKRARELKEKGKSTSMIIEELGISRDTLIRWCFDIPSKNLNHIKHLKTKDYFKGKGKENIKEMVIDKKNAKVFTSLIYWCEGSKYANCNCVSFTNSDINLIKTFLTLFRLGFDLDEKKFRVHLQLHTTHDKKEIISFWSNVLKIPESQFYKPTITKPLAKRKRVDYRGTCTVKYYDFSLFNEIVGTYEVFFKKLLR